ncbi:hypothetical protein [Rhizobium sp. BR 315]|uniref:hypothetical protein n=1 Tax=Rhizobium sp. BR 315 TaxID=3040014 RepID=UPI003D342E94
MFVSVTVSFSSGMGFSSVADAFFGCGITGVNIGSVELTCPLGWKTWAASPCSPDEENAASFACRVTDFKSRSPHIEFGLRSALRRVFLYSTVKLRLVFFTE